MVRYLIGKAVTAVGEPGAGGFLNSILRYRARFLWVFFFFFGLTLLYVLFVPRKYESDMSLVVQNARRPEVISPEPVVSTQPLILPVTEDQVNSQIEILGSTDVLDEVVNPGWRKVPLSAHSRDAELEHENQVYRLRRHLDIQPVRKSDVIDVSYRANDPKVATDTLSRVLAVFLEREKVISEPAGAARFFNNAAMRYQQEWAQAREQLSAFQQQHQMVSVSDKQNQLQLVLTNTLELQKQAEADADAIGKRLMTENAEHAATPVRQRTQEMTMPAAGSVDQVNTLLAQLNLRRAQLLTEYVPGDPLVKQVDSQIEQAKTELANARGLNSVQVATNVNPTWQLQDEAIQQDKAALRAARARVQTIGSQVAQLNGELGQTERDTGAYEALQHKVAEYESDYRLYLQKRDAAAISEAMNEQGLINIAVAQSPSFSLKAVRPRPLVDTLLGTVTAIFLALIAVYLAESARRTIGTPAELEAASRYPVLATVGSALPPRAIGAGAGWREWPARVVRASRSGRNHR